MNGHCCALRKFALVAVLAFSVVSCGGGKGGRSYWTDEQRATIDSLKEIGDDGHLYEMVYTADYKFDELFEKKDTETDEHLKTLKSLIVPDSKHDLALLSDFNVPIDACSAFAAKADDGKYIYGRNYDLKGHDTAIIVHTDPGNGKYASVAGFDASFFKIGSDTLDDIDTREKLLYAPLIVEDGINEEGLVCSVLALYCYDNDDKSASTKKPLLSHLVARYLLDNCKDVADVKAKMQDINVWPLLWDIRGLIGDQSFPFHWLVADKAGNAMVVEYYNSEVTFIEKEVGETYLGCTNHYLGPEGSAAEMNALKASQQSDYDFSHERMNHIDDGLSGKASVSYGEALDILRKCFGNTVWSQIFNITDCTMDIYMRKDLDTKYTFGIKKK